MDKKIVTLKEAKEKGFKLYFTGVPCKRGHISERYTTSHNCIECHYIKGAERYKKNRESELAKAAERYLQNKEVVKRRTKEWKAKNTSRVLELNRSWSKNNPDKVASSRKSWEENNRESFVIYRRNKCHKRRVRMELNGGSFTFKEILDMLDSQQKMCACCGVDIVENYQIDHIMPISKGGSNWIDNIQLLCPGCNRAKSDMHPDKWSKMSTLTPQGMQCAI
jgi:5-methylcytosine-specific restriction endonuclease McrA